MDSFENDVIDRLARLETKQDAMTCKLDEHLKHHYDVSIKTLFALISAGLSLIVSLFK
jgi:hypothetical protein